MSSYGDRASYRVYVDLVVRTNTVSIAVAVREADGVALQIADGRKVANTAVAMKRQVTRLVGGYGTNLQFIHEAGPCGGCARRGDRVSWSRRPRSRRSPLIG